MTMKLLLLALGLAPAAALIAELPDGDIFNPDVATEYMWCCVDAKCYSACAKLCMHGKGEFCIDGAAHPANNANQNGNHGSLTPAQILEILEELYSEGTTLPPPTVAANPFESSGGRKLEVETGCGERPDLPPAQLILTDWFVCLEEFFAGNSFAKAHCVNVLPGIDECCASTVCGGEPHFKTWMGEWYDYHGECDLMLIHAPSFAHGLGLDVHVRTKVRDDYSFIETAAIKIGSDVVEVTAWGQYMLNGVANADLDQAKLAGAFDFRHEMESKRTHNFYIDVGDHQIKLKSFKDFVSVSLDDASFQDFWDSTGMMGQFTSGRLLGRDGKTVYTKDNINEFGQEWQVRPEEALLFENTKREPQYPAQCRLPSQAVIESRRLGESDVSKADAVQACSAWKASSRDKCVYDVMATGDLELAEAGSY